MNLKEAKALSNEYALRFAHCIGKQIQLVWPNGHCYDEVLQSVEYVQTGKLVNAPDKVFDDAKGKYVTPHCMALVFTNNKCVFVLKDIVSVYATIDGAEINLGSYIFKVSIKAQSDTLN
jgi:hypothetical protein